MWSDCGRSANLFLSQVFAMDGLYTEPEYRVELYACNAESGRTLANFFRRLFGLKIVRTPKEAGDEVRRSYLRSADDNAGVDLRTQAACCALVGVHGNPVPNLEGFRTGDRDNGAAATTQIV